MADLTIRYVGSDYMLAPGPVSFEEPFYSYCVQEIAKYKPESIVSAFLSVPGMKVLHPAEPSWWEWEGSWDHEDRLILLDFTLLENSGHWGGSELDCDCTVADILNLWAAVNVNHPAVWLYGEDCRIYTPESFIAKWTG